MGTPALTRAQATRPLRAAVVVACMLFACVPGPAVQSGTTIAPSAPTAVATPTASPRSSAVGDAGPRDADASVAWQQLRQALPADIAVVRPTYVPSGLPLTVTYAPT